MDEKLEKNNIVAQWNIKPNNLSEDFLEEYNSCSLCGSQLQFTHVTHFLYMQVEEEAECPCCNVRLKKQTHSLQ